MKKLLSIAVMMCCLLPTMAQIDLYGPTYKGGYGVGDIIKLTVSGATTASSVYKFENAPARPGDLGGGLLEHNGKYYGVTYEGGDKNFGTVFMYNPVGGALTTIHSFTAGTDGVHPVGRLVLLGSRIYGMTSGVFDGNVGTIFSFDPAGSAPTYGYTKDYQFTGNPDGAEPKGSLVVNGSLLYGMTNIGGTNNRGCIFSFNPTGNVLSKLKDFGGTGEGRFPFGSLTIANGKLWGTTSYGGANNNGVVFSYDLTGNAYTEEFAFLGNCSTGCNPYGSLALGSDGQLYGTTTNENGNELGVLFSISSTAPSSSYAVRFAFDNTVGKAPRTSMVAAADGKIYGTSPTTSGTSGTVFSFTPSAGSGSITPAVVGTFTGANGTTPSPCLSTVSSNAVVVGMTNLGGTGNDGVIFTYNTASSTFAKLKDFSRPNGINPSGIIKANNGLLYGVSREGGDNGRGVIFSLSTGGTFNKLYSFDLTNGGSPAGSLLQGSDGKLYGLASIGGNTGNGVLFSYDITTNTYAVKHHFNFNDGGNPKTGLLQASNGIFYGTTYDGGVNASGVLFSYDPSGTGTYTKLKDFDGTGGNAIYPSAPLMQATNGKLYGTGRGHPTGGGGNWGGIYSYDIGTNTLATVVKFDGSASGAAAGQWPEGGALVEKNNLLYGTTPGDGSNEFGNLFSLTLTGTFTHLFDFSSNSGATAKFPAGSLLLASDGNLYGLGYFGGANDLGTAYKFDPGAGVSAGTNPAKIYDFNFSTGFRAYSHNSLIQYNVPPATWTGATSTDWGTAGNWSTNSVPAAGADITIPGSLANYPVLDGNHTVGAFSLASGASIDLNGRTLSIFGNLSNSGTVKGGGNSSLTIAGNGTVTGSLSMSQTTPGTTNVLKDLTFNRPDVSSAQQTLTIGSALQVTGLLQPTEGVIASGGNITLRSTVGAAATQSTTARVGIMGSNASITGDVVTERYIPVNTTSPRNGRAWRLLTIPVTGTNTLRHFFMGNANGTDLTVSGNRSAQTAGLGTVVIGHNHADATAATTAGFDYVGVPNQVSSLRRFVGSPTGGTLNSADVPSLSTTYSASEQGYAVYIRGDRQQDYSVSTNASATTLRATGVLKTGNRTIAVAAPATSMFTMVGNPYMAALNLASVHAANSGSIDPTFFIWDANLTSTVNSTTLYQGGFRTVYFDPGISNWTSLPLVANPQVIESGVAFFVKPTTGFGGGNITISESHKSVTEPTASAIPFSTGSTPAEYGSLTVTLEQRQASAEPLLINAVRANFHRNYTESANDPIDIRSMGMLGGAPIWLQHKEGQFAVEGRPWPMANQPAARLQVGVAGISADQGYQFRFQPASMYKPGLKGYLKDRVKGTEREIDLRQESVVEFTGTGNAPQEADRFEIEIVQGTLSPVNFLRANATPREGAVDLNWQVPADAGVRYEVERSTDAANFTTLHERRSAGSADNSYAWTDQKPSAGVAFYRIRATNAIGAVRYSEVMRVNLGEGVGNWSIYPNPVRGGDFRLELRNTDKGAYRIQVLDAGGRLVADRNINHNGGPGVHTVGLPPSVQRGTYVVRVSRDDTPVTVLKMVKE